ncbi:hypothetical protein CORC01_07041 [Colletotrichum orchidophilum]|uniref:DUF7514 domain-containing protein n=1 Tax=Colletotrichum orchidophilum TaxID=1209926 RepID=A0A1G4B8H7_9PEZI|nr:uncharacterized protein CORC01_07041 [Colletotrichum orchidophilum]OHE97626.1 hypothetical protein CORC01_07041 [Colletotrichum orchidophilum]
MLRQTAYPTTTSAPAMTSSLAGKAVRPRLNTTTNWSLPRDHAGRPEPEELSPLSPERAAGEYGWGQQKESHGHGNGHENRVDEQRGSDSLIMETLTSRPRDSLGSMSSDMLEELRKIIKEEVVQLKSNETGTPIDISRLSPFSSRNSVFTPAYPSPPPSIIAALGTTKTSSPMDHSPEFAHAKAASALPPQPPPPISVPVPAPQSTPPISPEQRAVRFRNRAPPVIHCQPRVESDNEDSVSPTAPAAPRVELSSVDKAWGVLFDSEGYPTNRLNCVLRGLANYMISDFGPPDTLVVTPEKMLMLYTKYKVEPERFQYEGIFKSRGKESLERIEFLYQDLDCQYHLVQAAPRSDTNIPGLTPAGFAKWMISNILAYPDPEARRLHAIMTALPINADGPLLNGKPERLPRQLSRHLFPEAYDQKVRKITDAAMRDCLEDIAPPLPSIPRSRPGPGPPPQDAARLPEANTHTRRSASDLKRPASLEHRSRTYDRGNHRVEQHPARLPRANSDTGASLHRHRDLPPPPVGRHSVSSQRQRSPAPTNRYTASLPSISQHRGSGGGTVSPLSQVAPSSLYDIRGGGDAHYGVYSGRDRDGHRGSDSRDESPRSPRSPGSGRRGGGGGDRGPTWEDVFSRKGSAGGRGSSVDGGSHRSFR